MKHYEETNKYVLSQLDDNTYLVIDKTNFFSNHYYKSLKAAHKKAMSI